MVYAQIKFMEGFKGTVFVPDGTTQQVAFRGPVKKNGQVVTEGEVYEVEILASRGRTADFRFVKVPEGSAVPAGAVIKNLSTAILGVNLGSYLDYKNAKAAKAEEN